MEGKFKSMATLVQSSTSFWMKLLEYCDRNYQCLNKNPQLFWMRKVARFEVLRHWITNFLKQPVTHHKIAEDNHSVFQDINVDEVIYSLENEGYAVGINLPQYVVQEIRKFADSATCYANRDPKLSFYYREKEQVETLSGKSFQLGSYFEAETCKAIKKLERDPRLLAIAAKFLGAAPIHIATELWWSFPVSATPHEQLKAAQVFHYDMDDYRFIKFFFYLTDVDLCSGPHVCIRGSHNNKKFLHQLLGVRCASTADQEIVDYYGAENVVTICGPAGLGFAEDTYCFHKGAPPTGKERLLLQIEFAIHDYGDIRNY
jgi:hypothetical protein